MQNDCMLINITAVVKVLGIPLKRRECLSVCMPPLSVTKMKYFETKLFTEFSDILCVQPYCRLSRSEAVNSLQYWHAFKLKGTIKLHGLVFSEQWCLVSALRTDDKARYCSVLQAFCHIIHLTCQYYLPYILLEGNVTTAFY